MSSAEMLSSGAFALSLGSGSLSGPPSRGTRSLLREHSLWCSAPCSCLDDSRPQNSLWEEGSAKQCCSRATRSRPRVEATGGFPRRERTDLQNPARCEAFMRCPDQWALVLSSGNKGSSEALLCRPMSEEQISAFPIQHGNNFNQQGTLGHARGNSLG